MYVSLWLIPILLQAPVSSAPEIEYIWAKLAEQGIIVLLMGIVIFYLKNKLDKREAEIKTLYELQSKEYMASLNIMAAASDSNNKLRTMIEEQPESLKRMLKHQEEVRVILESIEDKLNRRQDAPR